MILRVFLKVTQCGCQLNVKTLQFESCWTGEQFTQARGFRISIEFDSFAVCPSIHSSPWHFSLLLVKDCFLSYESQILLKICVSY
jgi:hypothetical protein